MQPNNPNDPIVNPPAPEIPISPEMPQPLNTSPQTPTVMPAGEPTPPIVPPVGGGLPPQLPNNPQVSKPAGKSKMLMIIGIIVVLLVLGVGAYYFYTIMGQNGESEDTEAGDAQTIEELNGLEIELENVEITDPDGDLEEVDSEITLLEATPSAE